MTQSFSLDGLPDEEECQRAQEIIDEINILAEDLPERGEDFGMSVMDQAADIAQYIEDYGAITPKQMSALENMLDGLKAWFND